MSLACTEMCRALELEENWRGLTLRARDPFEDLFARYQPEISEYTFTNLYIWNNYYNFKYKIINDTLFLLSLPEDGPPLLFPPIGGGDLYALTVEVFNELQDYGISPVMERVPESVVQKWFLEKGTFEITMDRDNSDYVYRTADLIELKGRAYHAKKNLINKFYRLYHGQYVRIKKDLVQECLELQEHWCNIRSCLENPRLYAEDVAVRTALTNIEALDFKAGAIVIEGKIQAFALGGQLNRDTAVVHIEKANPEVEGLYQVINQQFAQFELAGYTYVNREQDLGEPGLRKAKLSYLPDHMVNKYRMSLTKKLRQGRDAR